MKSGVKYMLTNKPSAWFLPLVTCLWTVSESASWQRLQKQGRISFVPLQRLAASCFKTRASWCINLAETDSLSRRSMEGTCFPFPFCRFEMEDNASTFYFMVSGLCQIQDLEKALHFMNKALCYVSVQGSFPVDLGTRHSGYLCLPRVSVAQPSEMARNRDKCPEHPNIQWRLT